MSNLFIYSQLNLDIAYQTYCSLTKNEYNGNELNLIKDWLKTDVPLANFYSLQGYSKACECFYLNDNTVVKTGMYEFIKELKNLINDDIKPYIVPTIIVILNKSYPISKEHLMFFKENCKDIKKEPIIDCLIFQPKVELLEKDRKYFYNWLKQTNIKQLTKDLNENNVGYLNGKPVIFDW